MLFKWYNYNGDSMENRKTMSFVNYLNSEKDSTEIVSKLYLLDKQLFEWHKRGYYVQNLDFDSIYLTSEDGYDELYPMFSNIIKASSDEKKQENIRDLAYLSLGIYVSLQTGTNSFYDYTKISRANPSFIKDNYHLIASTIPEYKEYYDGIVEGKYDYLNNYIANINKNGGKGNSHANVLSFSTPIGRAMAVNDNKTDAAFVSSMFYPIILICILVIAIMIYLLYRYL